MAIKFTLLLILIIVWSLIEIYLMVKDRLLSKGTTTIDRLSRLFNVIAITAALFSPLLCLVLPSARFAEKDNPVISFTGTFIALLGFVLRYWAIITLGKSFRTTVEIDTDQNVIRHGPYKYIRHPAYSGIILFFIGYSILSQNWASLVFSVLLPALALIYRISVEEDAFIKFLGPEYENYRKKTKRLMPFIW